jgi:hypothetical protein
MVDNIFLIKYNKRDTGAQEITNIFAGWRRQMILK